MRKIKFKPLVRLRILIQQFIYRMVGITGTFLFALLRALRLMKPAPPYDASKIKNILVVRPDRIGDLILATPVLYNLRQHFPEANIALLIQKQNQDLVSNNHNINQLLTINKPGIMVSFRNNLIRRLKISKFDLAIVLYSSFWSCLLVFLSGIPQRLGYDFHGSGFLLTLKLKYQCREVIKHEVDVNLDLLSVIGVRVQKKELEISLDPQAEVRMDKFLENNGVLPAVRIAVIHPGAYEEYIRWEISGFAAVADILIDDYKMAVIILGGPGEEEIVNKMMTLMKNKAISATGIRLVETVALIKRAQVFIGNSTGPMHIAAALKVPAVAIFGNVHPLDCFQKWGPYGTRSVVAHKDVDCKNCQPAECSDYRCMQEIEVEDVIEAVKRLI